MHKFIFQIDVFNTIFRPANINNVFNLTVAISLFQSAEMYIEMGKFGIPARHHEAIALIYAKVKENNSGELE